MSTKTKTLIVDGQWNLKRNFYKRKDLLSSNGHLCGGSFGFIDSLRVVMNKLLPDRVIVCWDGFQSGKYRYQIYPEYKSKRKHKNWENEERAIANDGLSNPQDTEHVEFLKQKIQLQNILEELFVRQIEVDYIEADDLIAQYVILSESDENEEVYIFSRDKDYLQLISDKVFIISSDSNFVINRKQYEEKYGHTLDNELLFKCFEGDDGDGIVGVNGIKRETLIKYFPNIKKEKYLYKRLIEECYEEKKDKKKKNRKIYDKIIEAEHILYRNAKLMNLKRPFVTEEAKKMVNIIRNGTLSEERSIMDAINLFTKEGMSGIVGNAYLDNFFSPFYMLMTKEKEYAKKMKI